jgi:hypothetical protein
MAVEKRNIENTNVIRTFIFGDYKYNFTAIKFILFNISIFITVVTYLETVLPMPIPNFEYE